MAIDEVERTELGAKIRTQRERKYGTKKAAYLKAEVNAATWDKAEAGESVRADLLRKIVALLWPETMGDWTEVPATETRTERETVNLAEVVAALEERVELLTEEVRQLRGDSA